MIHERCKSCVFRAESNYGYSGSCSYIQITGESRLKKVYKRLGVKEITDEVREAMKPENCRQYIRGPQAIVCDKNIALPGSMPKKKQTIPTVWPETPKIGETR